MGRKNQEFSLPVFCGALFQATGPDTRRRHGPAGLFEPYLDCNCKFEE